MIHQQQIRMVAQIYGGFQIVATGLVLLYKCSWLCWRRCKQLPVASERDQWGIKDFKLASQITLPVFVHIGVVHQEHAEEHPKRKQLTVYQQHATQEYPDRKPCIHACPENSCFPTFSNIQLLATVLDPQCITNYFRGSCKICHSWTTLYEFHIGRNVISG